MRAGKCDEIEGCDGNEAEDDGKGIYAAHDTDMRTDGANEVDTGELGEIEGGKRKKNK